MGEALEALTADAPLVLVLEDLHWSDYSTLDLISYLARQRQAAHLMVDRDLPAGGVDRQRASAQGGQAGAAGQAAMRGVAARIPQRGRRRAVSRRSGFPRNRFPAELAALIHERTEGNPLFMVNTIDYLVAERLIERARRRLAADRGDRQRQGRRARLDQADDREADRSSRRATSSAFSKRPASRARSFRRRRWRPDWTRIGRRRSAVRGTGPAASIHPRLRVQSCRTEKRSAATASYTRCIGTCCTSACRHRGASTCTGESGSGAKSSIGERASEIAAELAMHFERAANYKQAATYLQQAADNAMRRFAYQEAVALSRRGLELLEKLPDTPERARQELWLQLTLGVPLIATEGYAAPDVGSVYLKARQLCQRLGDTPEISQVLWGLWTFHTLRADLSTALEIAEEFLRLAERLAVPRLAMRGHWAMEITFTHLGEFALALEHFDKALVALRSGAASRRCVSLCAEPGRGDAVLCRLGALVSRPARSGAGPDPGSGGAGPRVIRTSRSGARALVCGDSSSASPRRADGAGPRGGRHRRCRPNTAWCCIRPWRRSREAGR